jgi:predicted NBD/HSP70 family sugar kinase
MELERRLGRPVHLGNAFVAATRALQMFEEFESVSHAANFVALFPGAILGVGLVVDGKLRDPSIFPENAPWLAPESNSVLRQTQELQFLHFRPRDFRKAIRKGNKAAEKFLRASVAEGVTAAARFIQASSLPIRCLVVAGGAADENKMEMVDEARAVLASVAGPDLAGEASVLVSPLGDLAFLLGAAALTRQAQVELLAANEQ